MRKRYSRKDPHWSPRFKWGANDYQLLVEFEKEANRLPPRWRPRTRRA